MQRGTLGLQVFFIALLLEYWGKPFCTWAAPAAAPLAAATTATPWWFWPSVLFVFCIVIGIVSVLGGVGSGVLYLALVSAFFPFHIDYVRTAALLVALSGALIAGSGLLRRNLAHFHLALPAALVGSVGAVCGALIGVTLPSYLIELGLGGSLLGVAAYLTWSRKVQWPPLKMQDKVGIALGMSGAYQEQPTRQQVIWKTHNTLPGLLTFFPVGLATGIFGLDGGWAHFAIFNLMMGVPLKVAVGTGKLLLTFTNTSAAWIYLHQGSVLPMIVIPSIIGIVLGSFLGLQAQLLLVARLKFIRQVALAALIVGGIKILLHGFAG